MRLRTVVYLTAAVVFPGCTYMVAESLDNCRFEAEHIAGWNLWSKMNCLEDKERKPQRPIVSEGKK